MSIQYMSLFKKTSTPGRALTNSDKDVETPNKFQENYIETTKVGFYTHSNPIRHIFEPPKVTSCFTFFHPRGSPRLMRLIHAIAPHRPRAPRLRARQEPGGSRKGRMHRRPRLRDEFHTVPLDPRSSRCEAWIFGDPWSPWENMVFLEGKLDTSHWEFLLVLWRLVLYHGVFMGIYWIQLWNIASNND